MENDCIPVNRKILYNDSLNCKEKIALIILLDTEAGSISYDHLAQKMDVTKPTAIATIKIIVGYNKAVIICFLVFSVSV